MPLAAPRAVLRIQLPFLAWPYHVPEPDVALVPGVPADYDRRHPDAARLIVQVADTSLPVDDVLPAR